MRKVFAVFALAAVLALSFALAGCSNSGPEDGADMGDPAENMAAWTDADSAADAAKGAGIDELIVPEKGTKLSIGELTDWTYCYTKDMAEADGGAGAATIAIRKSIGNGDNTGELSPVTADWSDLKTITYAHEWDMDISGTDVRCYGNVEGKAMKAIWAEGKYSYSILALGQGDTWKDFGLPADDITILVKGTQKAEADNASQEPEPGFDVEQAVFDNGLGEFVDYYPVENEDGSLSWGVVTHDVNGDEVTTYFDNKGNVISGGLEHGDVVDASAAAPGFDVEQAVFDNGLGEFVDYYPVENEDGSLSWGVVTHDVNGDEVTTYFDNKGNVIDGGLERGDVIE